jgi:hypothetical protein
VKVGSALTNNNLTGVYNLTIVALYTKTLRI